MDINTRKNNLEKLFVEAYQIRPTDYFSSPGRMEILGNHTDHNLGLVLVGAIDLDMMAAGIKSDDNLVEVISTGFNKIVIELTDLEQKISENGTSTAIVKGVLSRLKSLNYNIGSFKLYIDSSIFIGAGVSSSAAFECLIVEVINYFYNKNSMNPLQIAVVAQYAEQVYFNKPCGLLDQCGVAFGGVNLIDFGDINNPKVDHLEIELNEYQIVLVNTGGNHAKLVDQYKEIINEMKSVASYFNKTYLKEVKEKLFYDELPNLRKAVNDRAILRAIHFFEENKLVKIGYEALKSHDYEVLLKCIDTSGRNSFELLQNNINKDSCLQNIALGIGLSRSIIKNGAVRIHGGGFEGTILAIVNKTEVDNYCDKMISVFGEHNVHCLKIRNTGPIHFN